MPADDCTRITRSRCVHARVVAVVSTFLIIGLCAGVVPNAAAQRYKDRQVVAVLRDFQRQGVKVIFSTALVTPDMRVGEEPQREDPQDILIAILAPHDLTLRVGLRGILLVVRATSVVEPNTGRRAAANATTGAIAGTVRDRATRRPVFAATVRVEGTGLKGLIRDDGRFRLSRVPAGVRTLTVQTPGYEPLASVVSVSPARTARVLLEIVRVQPDGRVLSPSDRPFAVAPR